MLGDRTDFVFLSADLPLDNALVAREGEREKERERGRGMEGGRESADLPLDDALGGASDRVVAPVGVRALAAVH